MSHNRPRRFLSVALAIFSLGLAAGCANSGPLSSQNTLEDERPNIVVILVDDQRFDAFGKLNSKLTTPSSSNRSSDGVVSFELSLPNASNR